MRILIVEDEPTFAKLLMLRIRRHADAAAYVHLTVDWASSIEAARELLAGRAFDLIISDYHLPDGVGTDLVAEVESATRFRLVSSSAAAALAAGAVPKRQMLRVMHEWLDEAA